MKTPGTGRARRVAFLLIWLLLPARTPLAAQSAWSSVGSGTTATLNAIAWTGTGGSPLSPPSLGRLFIAGDSGKIVQSVDGGDSWTGLTSVPTTSDFNDIEFIYPDTGYVIGDGGIFRIAKIGGEYQLFVPDVVPTTQSLRSVCSIRGTVSGYAAGDSGTILRTTNRGRTWVAHNSRTTRNINAIKMATVVRVFACGDSGLILRSLSSGSWASIPAAAAAETDFHSIVLTGTFGDTAYVVGENGTILRSRNTSTTTPAWLPLVSGVTATLRSIILDHGTLWVVGDSGTILQSTNSGDTWTVQESGTTVNLRDILFPDAIHGYIVGENGTILRTTTGGTYGPLSCSPDPLAFGPVIAGSTRSGILTVQNSTDFPVDITFAASTNPMFTIYPTTATIPTAGKLAFTVGYSPAAKTVDTATIVLQADSGQFELGVGVSGRGVDSIGESSWSWLNPSPQGNPLADIGFFDAQHGVAVGEAGTILRTSDGGNTWTTTANVVGINSSFIALDIVDAQRAVAVGEYGLILSTTDMGATWTAPGGAGPVERLVSVSFAGTDTGYVVGSVEILQYPSLPSLPPQFPTSGSIYRTTDGGSTWENRMPSDAVYVPEIVYDVPVDIAAVSSNIAVAVGYIIAGQAIGTVFRTTDGGGHWNKLYPGAWPLRSVKFIDESTGIAVGDGGGIFRTTDGGANWSPISSPTGADLYYVAFSGANNGIAFSIRGDCLTTDDGGVSWILRPSPAVSVWRAIAFPGPDVAVGIAFSSFDGLTGPPPASPTVQQALYRSNDRGATWESITRSAETYAFRSVSFKDGENGVAITERGGILKTSDGGGTWRSLTGGTLLTYVRHPLTSVCYFPPDNIVVTGMYGLVLHSPDGGMTWSEQSSGTTQTLYAVAFEGPDAGYIVGANGTILRTTDTGAHWLGQGTSYPNAFHGVDLSDPANTVVVGDSGIILRTSNAGRNWDAVSGPMDQTLYDVSLAGLSGVAVGDSGAIVRSTDGGVTWHQADAGIGAALLGVCLSGSGTGTAVGDGGTILHTTDAGTNWTISPSGTNILLYDVAFVDDLVGTVVGGAGAMLRTVTGGMSSTVISDADLPTLPAMFGLDQNYPNPFNPVTTIRYRLPVESKVVLRVFDILGRVVATLVDAVRPTGEQEAIWDARTVASGVYIYRIEATPAGRTGAPFTREIRMVLVR